MFPKSFKRLSVRYSRDFVPQKTKNILVSVFSFVLAWTLSRLSPRNKPDQNRFVGLTYWKTSFPIHYPGGGKEFLASLIGGQNHKKSVLAFDKSLKFVDWRHKRDSNDVELSSTAIINSMAKLSLTEAFRSFRWLGFYFNYLVKTDNSASISELNPKIFLDIVRWLCFSSRTNLKCVISYNETSISDVIRHGILQKHGVKIVGVRHTTSSMWSVDRQPGYFVSFGAYQIYDTILNNMEIQAAENRWSCARFQKQINAGFCFNHAAIIKKLKLSNPNKLVFFLRRRT